MTKDEAIESLKSFPAKILLLGTVKNDTGEYSIAEAIVCTREETFDALKTMEDVRLFHLHESKKDAVYLKNESKKL